MGMATIMVQRCHWRLEGFVMADVKCSRCNDWVGMFGMTLKGSRAIPYDSITAMSLLCGNGERLEDVELHLCQSCLEGLDRYVKKA